VRADRLTLVTGGASSGKTSYACGRAERDGANVLYVATCVPRDEGMREKVRRHRESRPAHWRTREAARDVASALTPGFDAAIVDCVTLLISQMLIDDSEDGEILGEIESLAKARTDYPRYVVTNEVGCGVIPENALTRRFGVLQGRANQILAAHADQVVMTVCGLPLHVKG